MGQRLSEADPAQANGRTGMSGGVSNWVPIPHTILPHLKHISFVRIFPPSLAETYNFWGFSDFVFFFLLLSVVVKVVVGLSYSPRPYESRPVF